MGRAFYSSITLIGDKMYAVSRNSGTFVFDAGDKFKLLETNKLDDSIWNASPAVADGELYLRSNKTIYCISEKK
jgi:outer membrane protein assembly factor BamB